MSKQLKDMGFEVTAADVDSDRFRYHDFIPFQSCALARPLPFADQQFDYVVLAEVIEHLRSPFFAVREISRVLKKDGILILSTPNVLNLGSRLRFLFEGAFDFFREPTLDCVQLNPGKLGEMHIVVWRYQELEYLLFENDLEVIQIDSDFLKPGARMLSLFLLPFLKLQCFLRRRRAAGNAGLAYRRIDHILFSPPLLYGRHLILKARKGLSDHSRRAHSSVGVIHAGAGA